MRKEGRSDLIGVVSTDWVALGRVVLECVRGSARRHNNRLIEVIIWQTQNSSEWGENQSGCAFTKTSQMRSVGLWRWRVLPPPLFNSFKLILMHVGTFGWILNMPQRSWCSTVHGVCASVQWATRRPQTDMVSVPAQPKGDVFLISQVYLSSLMFYRGQKCLHPQTDIKWYINIILHFHWVQFF